jgi:predicted RNA-binding protein (virulence factor B family)
MKDEDAHIMLLQKHLPVYTRENITYFQSLEKPERDALLGLEKRLKKINRDREKSGVPLRFKVLRSGMDDKLKALIINELDAQGGDFHDKKKSDYIHELCKLPLGKFKQIQGMI